MNEWLKRVDEILKEKNIIHFLRAIAHFSRLLSFPLPHAHIHMHAYTRTSRTSHTSIHARDRLTPISIDPLTLISQIFYLFHSCEIFEVSQN